MAEPIRLKCDACGSMATIIPATLHIDAKGRRIETPRASVKADGIYFAINCPQCGEREQCLARSHDSD